jgi:HD-like signal output (HDOD) protein
MTTHSFDSHLTIDDIASRVKEIPAIPDVILKISQELENPNITADKLGQLVQMDPKLTAQLLRMCNSAYYSLNREVTNMKEAVAMLGLKTLKSLIYAIMSHQVLNKPIEGYGLKKGSLWRNALTGAVISRVLARCFTDVEPDTAFTACILRDLGKLVLEQYVGEAFQKIEHLAVHKRLGFDQAEREHLGFSHTELGAHLAEKWKIPNKLIYCIRYHHHPSDADISVLTKEECTLLAVVHLADSLTMMIGEGVGLDGLSYGVDTDYLKAHGFDLTPVFSEQLLSLSLMQLSEVESMFDSISS